MSEVWTRTLWTQESPVWVLHPKESDDTGGRTRAPGRERGGDARYLFVLSSPRLSNTSHHKPGVFTSEGADGHRCNTKAPATPSPFWGTEASRVLAPTLAFC